MTTTSRPDPRHEALWEFVFGLLDDEQAAALTEQIRSDPALARQYAEVRLQADLLRDAARLELPGLTLLPPTGDQPLACPARRTEVRKAPVPALARTTWWLPAGWLAAAVLLAVGGYRLARAPTLPELALPVVELRGPARLWEGQPGELELHTQHPRVPAHHPRPAPTNAFVQVLDRQNMVLYDQMIPGADQTLVRFQLPNEVVRPGVQLRVLLKPAPRATEAGQPDHRQPEASLRVDLPVQALQILVHGVKERWQPGEEVALELAVADTAGEPVPATIHAQLWEASPDRPRRHLAGLAARVWERQAPLANAASHSPADALAASAPETPAQRQPAGAERIAAPLPGAEAPETTTRQGPAGAKAWTVLASNREEIAQALRHQEQAAALAHRARWRSGLILVAMSALVALAWLILPVSGWCGPVRRSMAGLSPAFSLLAASLLLAVWGWRQRPHLDVAGPSMAMAPAGAAALPQQASPDRDPHRAALEELARAQAALSRQRFQTRERELIASEVRQDGSEEQVGGRLLAGAAGAPPSETASSSPLVQGYTLVPSQALEVETTGTPPPSVPNAPQLASSPAPTGRRLVPQAPLASAAEHPADRALRASAPSTPAPPGGADGADALRKRSEEVTSPGPSSEPTQLFSSDDLRTDSRGRAFLPISLPRPGSYRLVLQAVSAEGAVATAELDLLCTP